jgi:low temperature requirement protein LtrA
MVGTWILIGLCVAIWGAMTLAGFSIAAEPQYGASYALYYLHFPLIALIMTIASATLALWAGRHVQRQVIGRLSRASLGLLIVLILPYGFFYTGGM